MPCGLTGTCTSPDTEDSVEKGHQDIRNLAEELKGHFLINVLRPVCQALSIWAILSG